MQLKSFLLAGGLFAASLSAVQAAPARKIVPNGATSFTSKAQRFAVWLPSQPTRSEQPFLVALLSPEKPQYSIQTLFKVNSGLVDYTVCVRPPLLFDKFYASIISEWKSRRYEEVTVDEILGRDREQVHRTNGKVVRTRLYLTPKITYSISAIGPETGMQQQAAQIDKVLDSFHISPQ